MRVPLSWLREFVALPPEPAALVERLTLAGLESPGSTVFGLPAPAGLGVKADAQTPVWDRDTVVVGTVREISKVPGADKLKFVTLDIGTGTPKTVITGAPNIAPGQSGLTVVVGLRGCRYFFQKKADEPKAVVTLEPRKLMGHDNDAMCMSNFELGIADDHDGIILLDPGDAAPGTPAVDVLGEVVVELDVLPNMARCLSVVGVAREVAALTGAVATVPTPTVTPSAEGVGGKVRVEITDPKLCPRYTATIVRTVASGPAPRWMRSRLHYAGMRPVSGVVDITNYVMLERGQPLHAFDYDALVKRAGGQSPVITVRPAAAGERLKTLDGVDRELTSEDLVIADAAGPVALAGVMGGAETEVTPATTTILLESAAFDPVSVRKTARRFNLPSEASGRFSRGVHPELAKDAALRAAELLGRHAGGEVLAGMVDEYPAPPPPQVVELPAAEIRRLLGFAIPPAEVERVLTALQFTVKPTAGGWVVTVPQTRLDIQAGAADLIEELAGVSGYDRLPERLLPVELPDQRGNRPLELEEATRDILADQGLQEAVTYSFTSPAETAKLNPDGGAAGGDFVTLLNPISPERSVLRRTLLPGLLKVAADNLATAEGVAFFEVGAVFHPKAGEPLPDEPRRVAVVLCGRRTVAAWDDSPTDKPMPVDFFDLKGVVETLAADLHVPAVGVRPAKGVPHLHPGKAAELVVGGSTVGAFGELHPTVAAAFGLAERAVQVAELDLDALLAAVPDRSAYRPFSTFPPAKRDIAVVVPRDTPAAAVLAEVRAAAGDLLADARLFDVYTGEHVPAGTKSLAFALAYQAPDRTLGDKEIDKAHGKVEGRLRHVLKAQIRGVDVK